MSFYHLLNIAGVPEALHAEALAALALAQERAEGLTPHKFKVRYFKAGKIAELRDWEDGAGAVVHPVTHTYKRVSLGGGAHFHAVELVNGWRLRFPLPGNYTVVGNLSATISSRCPASMSSARPAPRLQQPLPALAACRPTRWRCCRPSKRG